MKCPYCSNDMEKGVIEGPHEIAWKKKSSLIGRAKFHDGSVVLSELSMLKGSKVIAYLCRGCEKVIVDYSDNTCDANHTK